MPKLVCGQSGKSLLEFVIVGPFFFLFVLLALDMLRISYQLLTVQFVGSRVFREAIVGPPAVLPSGTTHLNFVEDSVVVAARDLGIDITPDQISVCPVNVYVTAASPPCGADNLGHPGDLIVMDIQVPTNGFVATLVGILGRNTFILRSIVIVQNEPYDVVPTP